MNNFHARLANDRDIDQLFEWANNTETRNQSFSNAQISYADHVSWFHKKLEDENCLFFIFVDDQDSVGSIRLDKEYENKYLLSYQVAPNMRGKGYGTRMLGELDHILKDYLALPSIEIEGAVKPQNIASSKCFESNGYLCTKENDKFIYNKTISLSSHI